MALTEANLQDAVQGLYEGDTSTPAATDEDYLARREIFNAAINRWEEYEGTLWRELWGTLTDAADGTKTTAASTLAYSAPTNFRFPGGYVRLSGDSNTYYRVIPVEKVQALDNVDKKVVYFTGNPQDGYNLNFLDQPEASKTILYEYYKTADTITATTDNLEMADPYFVVYFALARLYKQDNQIGNSTEAFREAESRLQQMKIKNMMQPPFQEHAIDDLDYFGGVLGFGK